MTDADIFWELNSKGLLYVWENHIDYIYIHYNTHYFIKKIFKNVHLKSNLNIYQNFLMLDIHNKK